jgi:CDP-diacylglycerol--glycerol-3-phosphate 3-phosphatidyltransferase
MGGLARACAASRRPDGKETRVTESNIKSHQSNVKPDQPPASFSDRARGWSARLVVPMATALGRLGFTPDGLTLIGLALILATAVVLALGHNVWGGALFIIAGIFDALDGTLARVTNRQTRFGAFLDSTCDRYADAAILFGVMVPFLQKGQQIEVMLAFIALVGSVLVSYTRARAEGLGLECKVGLLTRFERFIIIAIGLFFNLVTPMLWVMAILTNVTAIQRMVHVWTITRE